MDKVDKTGLLSILLAEETDLKSNFLITEAPQAACIDEGAEEAAETYAERLTEREAVPTVG